MPVKSYFTTTLFFLFTLFVATANAQVNVERKTVSNEKFERLMKKKKAVVVDVRTTEEYNAGHIPGAVHIDVLKDDFTQQIQPLDKKKTYLLYCKSGRRSEKALNTLYDNGFKKVYHLKGGFTGWTAAKE